MSVFGGDSWGREAQHRKRKLDDLLTDSLHGYSYKKLPSGKFACLVCPHNPVLDTPLMLSIHCKGSRHVAAEAKVKEKEARIHIQKTKRLAISDSSSAASSNKLVTSSKKVRPAVSRPLTGQGGKAASEVISLCNNTMPKKNESPSQIYHGGSVEATSGSATNSSDGSSFTRTQGSEMLPKLQQKQSGILAWRERELKFTEAGWIRDGHGRWYKDENVEFDSDEEDPNIALAGFQP